MRLDNKLAGRPRMSRWDALKPVEKGPSCRNTRKQRYPTRDDSETDVLQRYSSLRQTCCLTRPISVVALAKFVYRNCSLLPAEETAVSVVQDIFLDVLESAKLEHATGTSVLQAISALLQDHKHASSIMAALTDNVLETGKEQVVVNPVRHRLFAVLETLIAQRPVARLDTEVCECLIVALRVTKRIDGTQCVHSSDVNLVIIQSYLDRHPTEEQSQRLLLAVLQRHPSSSARFAGFLWLRNNLVQLQSPDRKCCRNCGFCSQGAPEFLQLLHGGKSPVAIQCMSELLHSLPLSLWVKRGPSPRNQSETFQDRVSGALEDVLRCALCYRSNYSKPYGSLVKAILTLIPYQNQNQLNRLAGQLIDKLMSFVTSNSLAASEDFIECLGGRITPQGSVTRMSLPIAAWLRRPRGQTLVEELLFTGESTKLLCAIVRVCPDVVLCEKGAWELFQKATSTNPTSQNYPLAAAQLVDALMKGRADYGTKDKPVVSSIELISFVLPIMDRYCLEGSNAVKCAACSAFGCLLSSDWKQLSSAEHYISNVLSLCTDRDVSAKVRTESCKSIGDLCEKYMAKESAQLGNESSSKTLLCNDILRATLLAMADSAPSVKCMALFAAGNLVQSLYDQSFPVNGLNTRTLGNVADLFYVLMTDINEKVATNAIRSTGHVACLFISDQYRIYLEETTDFRVSFFLERAVRAFVVNVRAAVELARGNGVNLLSWKQRSAVKKRGRGACNSLALLYKQGKWNRPTVAGQCHCHESVQCLLECVDNLSLLNDKVAISALVALRSLDRDSLLQSLEGHELANAINSCCVFHFAESSSLVNEELSKEVDAVFSHLLACVALPDASHIIRSVSLQQEGSLGLLYQWMVAMSCAPETFGYFACAMQTSSVGVDFQIEQQFSNRAMSLYDDTNSDQCDEL